MKIKQQSAPIKPLAPHALPSPRSLRLGANALLVSALLFGGCACPSRKAGTSCVAQYYAGREDGLVERDEWTDAESGGGFFLFTDPSVQSLVAIHTNQSALGGGSSFVAGKLTIVVDSNTAPIISAGGTAVGNVIGAAAKSAVK